MGDQPDQRFSNGLNVGRLGAKTQINVLGSAEKEIMMDINDSDGFK